MAQLLNLIREQVAYVESMVQMTNASTAAEAMRNSKQVIMNRIDTTAVLSSCDATACLRALRDSNFNVVDRNDLATGINQRMARTGTAYADRQGTQSCLKLHHYLGMHHWHDLSNPNTWWQAKLELLVAILMDLGLTHPSPVTITHIVTMTTIAVAHGMDLHKINPLDIYGKAQELKARLRSARLRERLPHEGVVINYPNTASELLEANEIVYNHFYKVGTEQEFTAAPCPINETALAVLRSRLPTRSTHTAIASLTNRVMPRSFSRSLLSLMAPQPRDEAHDACVTISIEWGQMQEFTPAPCPMQEVIPIAVKAKPIAVKANPKAKAKGRAKGKHASNATKKTPPTIKRPAGNFKRPAGKRTRKAT